MENPVIILGTAHLNTTPGKRSPDGKLRECSYSRIICARVAHALSGYGLRVMTDYVPESPSYEIRSSDPKEEQRRELKYRRDFVNRVCSEHGRSNCLYISIHVNAAGDGSAWQQAGGWSAYTTRGNTASDAIAEHLYEAAAIVLEDYAAQMDTMKKIGVYSSGQRALRTDLSDGDRDLEAGFYVLNAACPAVLTENLFMDNPSDVRFLLSERGMEAVTQLHVNGILSYLRSVGVVCPVAGESNP